MKLLVDARTLGKQPSGVGMYLYNFICGLMQYETIQIEVITDVAQSAEMKKLDEAHIPIHGYGKIVEKSVGVYAYFHFVQRVIHEVKPDIFWEGNNLMPIVMKNPYGRIVTTVYDVFPLTAPDGYGRIYPWYFKWNLGKTLRSVDAVIYDSRDAQTEVERYFPVAKGRTSYVSYIITENMPELPVTDDDYFLYIGNLEKRKGTDLLLNAYARYWKEGGRKKLYLAGKIRSEEIDHLLKKCSAEIEGVCYKGYLEPEDKYKMYAACSAFVFPSRAEGFGMPVVEALAYDKEVIVTDLQIFREIAEDAVCCCKMSENIEATIENITRAMHEVDHNRPDAETEKIKSNRRREIVERYRKERLAQGMRDFFEKVMKTGE